VSAGLKLEIYRSPNTSIRQRAEARHIATERAALLAREGLVNSYLDGRVNYGDAPLTNSKGKLDYEAAKSAVARGEVLGLIS